MKINGIKKYTHPKTGITYRYHRASNTRLTADPDTEPELFYQQWAEAERKHKAFLNRAKLQPKTLSHLIFEYKKTSKFKDLSAYTKRDYNKAFEYLHIIGRKPLTEITPGWVFKLQTKALEHLKWRWTNYTIGVLSMILKYAKNCEYIATNPASDIEKIKRPRMMSRKNRRWLKEELEIVMAEAPPHLLLPIAIARYTGLRRANVLTLLKSQDHGYEFRLKTAKNNEDHELDIEPELRQIIDNSPKHNAITICANSRGLVWTHDGFNASFFKFLKRLEDQGKIEAGLSFHGIRATVGSELADKGQTNEDVAHVLRTSTRIAATYTRDAKRRKTTSKALKLLGK